MVGKRSDHVFLKSGPDHDNRCQKGQDSDFDHLRWFQAVLQSPQVNPPLGNIDFLVSAIDIS